jgi:hypothetical protein|tara:strand:- start:3765 stop:3896 length:132 start_codon:yes stop_codon:yes gene_type:complete
MHGGYADTPGNNTRVINDRINIFIQDLKSLNQVHTLLDLDAKY